MELFSPFSIEPPGPVQPRGLIDYPFPPSLPSLSPVLEVFFPKTFGGLISQWVTTAVRPPTPESYVLTDTLNSARHGQHCHGRRVAQPASEFPDDLVGSALIDPEVDGRC